MGNRKGLFQIGLQPNNTGIMVNCNGLQINLSSTTPINTLRNSFSIRIVLRGLSVAEELHHAAHL